MKSCTSINHWTNVKIRSKYALMVWNQDFIGLILNKIHIEPIWKPGSSCLSIRSVVVYVYNQLITVNGFQLLLICFIFHFAFVAYK